MATPPSGFIARPRARSTSEAVSLDSHDRIVSIAKNALQSYIASFLDSDGLNRSYIKTLSPQAAQYVTDKSLQDHPDPSRKPLQLARMFNDIRQRIPCIMIVDSGLTYESAGIGGGLERTSAINGNWQGWYRVYARVNVIVACVTNDVESCSTLQTVVSMMCMQLRHIAGGARLVSNVPGSNWECRLPTNFTSSSASPTQVADDPKDAIWAATLELELQVEDLFCVERPILQTVVDGGVVNNTDLAGSLAPVIDAPDSVRLRGGPFQISVTQLGMQHSFSISDPTVATIDPETQTITPHRTGSFDIFVLDDEHNQSPEKGPVPWARRVVASKTVTVTF